MKISTKGRYGLEAVIAVAMNGPEYSSLREIASRMSISDNYLEQIFLKLRRGGIVESARGTQGGYRLAKDPNGVTAGDVLRILEGPLVPVVCLRDRDYSGCGMADNCPTRCFWEEMTREINQTADSVTIGGIVSKMKSDGKEKKSR